MARNLKAGDRVNGYTILDRLGSGATALSYKAKSPKGEVVFLKQYKSPSITVAWYKNFIKYQKEFRQRIESTNARRYCYKFIDFFEAECGCKTYFQAYEFITKGHDLQETIDKLRKKPDSVSWEHRVIYAKVMMAGVAALHDAGVIHSDLKPPNIHLVENKTITLGYEPKLIDMDYSILLDKRAPWHGEMGYIGSPNYMSPEHFVPGGSPLPASDVFTCGLMLYELLGNGHPYWFDDDDEYLKAIKSYKAKPLNLQDNIPAPANNTQVEEIIYRCLNPDPKVRPTAKEVNLALNGRNSHSKSAPPEIKPLPEKVDIEIEEEETSISGTSSPPVSQMMELIGDSGRKISLRIRTDIGKELCKCIGSDACYFDVHQFTISPEAGEWIVVPNPKVKNETLLNGRCINTPTKVTDGDVLAVGRESKGIVKLPLRIRLS
jgi:serine/threonine protein kinase